MLRIKLLIVVSILTSQVVFSQGSQNVNNLIAFSRAYGYVKYFHPSDEAYGMNWDQFAAYGSKEVEKCENNAALVRTLNRLFHPIAPTAEFMLKQDKMQFNRRQLIPKDVKDYQQIYWQHNGVSYGLFGDGYKESPYQSVRVNRADLVDQSAQSGDIRTFINPANLIGKEFKVEGWAKLKEGSEGSGCFWILGEKKNNQIGLFNKTVNNPVNSTQWERFEMTGTIKPGIVKLSIGCYLVGKGSLYADNFKLSVKENGKWVNVEVKNGDFEDEKIAASRKKGIAWNGNGRGYSYQIDEYNSFSGQRCARIDYVGEFITKDAQPLFESRPNFGEIIEKEISPNVYCQIPLVVYGNETATYPKSDEAEYKQLRQVVATMKDRPEDLYFRLGNVIITHNVFKHFYPYFDEVDVDWDAQLSWAIKQSYSDKSGTDHLKTMEMLTAKLHDGHVKVMSGYAQNFMPSILWEWVEDQLVITHVGDSSLAIKRGDVVEKVDNLSPQEFFQSTEERISAATDGWLNYVAKRRSLEGKRGSKLTLQINSKEYELERKYTWQQVEVSRDDKPVVYQFYKDGKIAYLNFDLIGMKTIDKLMSKLKSSKAIICDFRGHPKGTIDFICQLLKRDANDKGWLQIPQIIYPDLERISGYETGEWDLRAKKPYLGGKKIVFIVDGRAISKAESCLSFVEGYKLGTIIGEPTAGTNGVVNMFSLPGTNRISWTGMRALKHDGSQHHGVGIIPNIKVEKTIKGVKDGRDEFLEKALELVE
ncbi:peptidase S41 [Puteibacter caeruleilacunae]|nr:peptidase S41 [Puteibacter caeruleilacunae]